MANQPFNRAPMELSEEKIGIQPFGENWGRVQSGSLKISDVLRPYRRTEGTSQNNSVAAISSAGGEHNNKESRNIKKSWEMLKKARIYLAKNAPQDDKQQISQSSTTVGKTKPILYIPQPMKMPRNDGDGVSAYHCNHDVSYPNKGLPGTGALSTIEKREVARSEDVKAEIQSLVKHNLSAMHKNKKKLGSNGYKEVARVSTHTILAAYGFEHHQTLARLFSRPLCNHNKDISNLVPYCCRDCFRTFVRQVVESVLLEKM